LLTVWSWLRKALRSPSDAGPGGVANVGHGGFNFEVVGEQSYQNRLRKVSAGPADQRGRVTFQCHLRYEINSHTHAPAVRVDTSDGHTVGYFSAAQAEVYAAAFHELEEGGQSPECQGLLLGGQPGRPSFGVWLDFKPKLLEVARRGQQPR
jgi:hypothetical protein